MRKFNIAEEKLAMLRPQHILLGDLASPEHFLNDPRLDQVTHVSTAPLSPRLAATRSSGRLTLKVRCVWRNGWRRCGLQRFLHVGTAMSCSPEPDSLVAESAEFRNAPSTWWNTPTRNQPSSS
jgi:hypothetical protein